MPIYNQGFHQVPQAGAVLPLPHPQALQGTGPVIQVQVEVPTALATQLQHTGQTVPQPVLGYALIDTGASLSAVDATVIQQLGVQPVGVAHVGTAGGPQQQATCPARFSFPGSSLPAIDFNQLLGANLSGQLALGAGNPLVALLGRDLLQHFVLIYNGPAAMFTLAF